MYMYMCISYLVCHSAKVLGRPVLLVRGVNSLHVVLIYCDESIETGRGRERG